MNLYYGLFDKSTKKLSACSARLGTDSRRPGAPHFHTILSYRWLHKKLVPLRSGSTLGQSCNRFHNASQPVQSLGLLRLHPSPYFAAARTPMALRFDLTPTSLTVIQ